MDKNNLAWNLYQNEREFIQHHENQRTTASNILAAIAAGLIVALGTDKLSNETKILISFLLSAMGLFGFIFCSKLYALIKLHANRSYQYLSILESDFQKIDVDKIKSIAKEKNKARFKWFGKLGLNTIWRMFHLFIFFTGLGSFILYLAKLFF